MAVAYDASSKTTTEPFGTPGTSWTHTPSGTPRGVLVFTYNDGGSTDTVSAVSYGGSSLGAVTGGFAQDTAGESGNCKAWFLGSSVPTGGQTVSITASAGSLWAVCITVTAGADTEVYEAGILLEQENQTLAEESISDGSTGVDSQRFAGLMTGLATPPSAGANSTVIQSFDDGAAGFSCIRETTAGQGARSIGWSSGTSDDVAAVYLAVREVVSAVSGIRSFTFWNPLGPTSSAATGGGTILPWFNHYTCS